MAKANGNVVENAAASEATKRLTEMSAANTNANAARRAALNLMEDAVLSNRKADELNVQLRERIGEHERAEARLHESEQRFVRFMENLPGLAWIKDSSGRYVFVNDAAERAFGRSKDELYGKTDLEIFSPQTAKAFIENDKRAISRSEGIQTIEALTDPEGVERYSVVSKFPIAVDGEAPLLGGIAIDITEQQRAQANQEFLFKISERIRTAANAEDLLADISRLLGQYLGIHRCLFNEIDLDSDTETVHRDYSSEGESIAGRHKISDYSAVASEAMSLGQTIVNHDSQTDPRTAELFEKTYAPAKELAYIAVPMLREGKWVASLWCSDDRARKWRDDEVSLVESIAERVWTAVERLRTLEQIRQVSRMPEENPHPVMRISGAGEIIYANPAAKPLLEHWAREYTNRMPSHIREGISDALGSGEKRQIEIGFDETVLDCTLAPVADAGYVNFYGTDITSRKRAEKAQAHLAAIVTTSEDAIISKDLDGVITTWNRGAQHLFGYSAEEAIGKSVTILIPADHLDEEPQILARIRRGEAVEHYETVRQRKDGSRLDISLTVSPLRDPAGRIIGASKIARDITERKRAEMALRESEERFRNISNASPVLIWMSDTTKNCIWFNKAWLEFTGRTMDGDTVDCWETNIHPDDVERCVHIYTTCFDKRQPFSIEYRLRRSDGSYRWVLDKGIPRISSDGEFLGYIGGCVDIDDRRAAEAALRQSEARLQLATRIGNYGTWDLNYSKDRMVWSDKLFEIAGLAPTRDRTMSVDRFSGLVHPDDAEVTGALIRNTDPTQHELTAEFRMRRASTREWRWIHAAARIFYDASGTPVRSVGIARDITERKAVEEKIRANAEQLRVITDTIPALVSYIDRDERYVFVNRQYRDWFNLPEEKIIRKRIRDVVGQRAYKVMKPRIDEVLAGNEVAFTEWLNYKGAGKRYVHVSYVPDRDEDGGVKGYYALVNDLTEQKRAEELLRASEDRMKLMSESFTEYAIISMDAEGRIDSWNPGARNIFGYEDEDVIGLPSDILFTPEDVMKGVPLQEMRNARKVGRASDERWHVRKDGTRFFASGVTVPLYMGRRLSGYAKIARDLTERKKNAEALQHAYDEMEMRVLERTRELSQTNASLIDEINMRKTAERQKITLLQRLVSSQEDERRRIARDLHDHLGQRLTALRLKLASLRDSCKTDAELLARATRLQQIAETIDSEVSFLAWQLRPSVLDELGLIDAIQTFVKEWSRHYETKAEFHSTGFGEMRLDREMETHLYRIMQEALNNIVKHADATAVSVLLEKSGENVVLIIEDDGKGFDIEHEMHADKGSRGLGLAGMHERADLIGGELEVESEPGKGTTIYVRIHVAELKSTKND